MWMALRPTLLCASCATHYSGAGRESLSQSVREAKFFSDNFSIRRGRLWLEKGPNGAFPEKGSAFPFSTRGMDAHFGTISSNRPASRPLSTKLPKSSQNGVERPVPGGLRFHPPRGTLRKKREFPSNPPGKSPSKPFLRRNVPIERGKRGERRDS